MQTSVECYISLRLSRTLSLLASTSASTTPDLPFESESTLKEFARVRELAEQLGYVTEASQSVASHVTRSTNTAG